MSWWQQPFFQVAVPIIITFVIATWYQSSRITDLKDSMGKRLDELRSDMNNRFAGIEKRLDKLEAKVEGIQERTWR